MVRFFVPGFEVENFPVPLLPALAQNETDTVIFLAVKLEVARDWRVPENLRFCPTNGPFDFFPYFSCRCQS